MSVFILWQSFLTQPCRPHKKTVIEKTTDMKKQYMNIVIDDCHWKYKKFKK